MGPDRRRDIAGLERYRLSGAARREGFVAFATRPEQLGQWGQSTGQWHADGQPQIGAAVGDDQMHLTALARIENGEEVHHDVLRTHHRNNVNHHRTFYARTLRKDVRGVSPRRQAFNRAATESVTTLRRSAVEVRLTSSAYSGVMPAQSADRCSTSPSSTIGS